MKLTYIVMSGLDIGALAHNLQQLLKHEKHILVEVVTEGRTNAPKASKVSVLSQEGQETQKQVPEAYRFSD